MWAGFPWAKTFPDLGTLNNPAEAELRSFAVADARMTDFGAPAFSTRMGASGTASSVYLAGAGVRLGRSQRELPPQLLHEVLQRVAARMPSIQWISMDRIMGASPGNTFHCRLLVPRAFARIAWMWSKLLFPADPSRRDPRYAPDLLTVFFPDWLDGEAKCGHIPERLNLVHPEAGISYVLGTDCAEEARTSFFRQAMHRVKRLGGLGLHAGSKTIWVRDDSNIHECGMLLVGLPGTGKTTLTMEDHRLVPPESVTVLQDDIVLWSPDGKAYGTEDNFYVRTNGLTRDDQPGLFDALISPSSIFENVPVGPAGKIRFAGATSSADGRAVALRSRIPNTGDSIDLARVHKLILITRHETIMPPLARLTPEQAAAYFMLGESAGAAGGDSGFQGPTKHQVGFNPLVIGPEEDEGNRLLELLKSSPGTEVYLLNTGSIGKGADLTTDAAFNLKITKNVSTHLLSFVVRQKSRPQAGWRLDRNWEYEVPIEVPGIPLWKAYTPSRHYTPSVYVGLVRDLREERRAWLTRFPGLKPEVRNAI
ncbi:MAG: phosphoenolpyruvate carboxykinase [Elusimicrobia bacterium]|nr:phosphoenolpyruvate carboxykinase [Elusimicrobiota bacterium]